MTYTVEIPQSLRKCANIPERPDGRYTQREVAVFVARLDSARRDCKTKLKSLVGLIDQYNENAKNANPAK